MKIICLFLLLITTAAISKVSIETDEKYRYLNERQFRVPLNPQENKIITPLAWGAFGVALNGIPFDPNSTAFWDLDWRYEKTSDKINLELDREHAHIQPSGSYHYQGTPRKIAPGKKPMLLLGWAADGYPIYSEYGFTDPDDLHSPLKKMKPSYRLKSGIRKTAPKEKYDGTFVQDYEYVEGLGDLDACNGRFGKTTEYPEGIYHYFLTDAFPFIPRYFKGIPDPTFLNRNRRRH